MSKSVMDPKRVIRYLAAVPGIGPQSLRLIISDCKKTETNLAEVYRNPDKIAQISQEKKIALNVKKFKKEYSLSKWEAWLKQRAIKVVDFADKKYPPLLKQVSNAPPVLWYRGNWNRDWWQQPVAVIGSRNMTAYGSLATRKIVSELVSLGCTIISGGMYGVDLTAHQVAIAQGGKTALVLGHGFVQTYPEWLAQKHQQILEAGGVLISPFSPLTLPSRGTFVARNRVVAGLVKAVVVVEAAEKSGTFSTVHAALEENREVCTVPGPITNPYSLGIKYLVNQGATVVTSGLDVIESFMVTRLPTQPDSTQEVQQIINQLQPLARQILSNLIAQPLSFDQLAQQLAKEMDSGQLAAQLSLLELKGFVVKFGQTYRVADRVVV